MADSYSVESQLVLDDDPVLGRVSVDMESFFEFSFWMAEELEDMKAQWQHNEALQSERERVVGSR